MSPADDADERRLLNELSRINNDYGTRHRQVMQELARTRHQVAAAQSVLGAVAHDLRTPLQSVLGFAEFLLDEELDPHQRDLARRIATAAAQMSRLADELLDTVASAADEAGGTPVDVRAVVDELVSRRRLLGSAHGIEVREEIALEPGSRPQVLGDRDGLQRVLDNLVGNAVKFSPESGTVTVSLALHGDTVVIAVADEGPGIEPGEQDAVFEPFHRTAAAALVPGTGLGLAIARQIVERHHGSIGVQSEPGHGATFTVRLPALPD
jgi:signal transduction histidine kinase